MPKMKTNSGAKKRFRSSSTGKIKRERAFGNHILTKKNAARRRRLRTLVVVEKVDQGRLNRLMPYGPTR